MENSSCSKGDIDQNALIRMCFELVKELRQTERKFSFTLKLETGFNFSLSSDGSTERSPETTKKRRSGSYLRRQAKRREAFLKRKENHVLGEDATETRQIKIVGKDVADDTLDKSIVSSELSKPGEEDTVVGIPLDLNPKATLPTESNSEELEESSEDEEEDEESEEMEDSDKEGDRCGTDARSRQKEREADSVPAAWQKCSCSVHKGVCLACIHQRFLKWKKSSEKGPT